MLKAAVADGANLERLKAGRDDLRADAVAADGGNAMGTHIVLSGCLVCPR